MVMYLAMYRDLGLLASKLADMVVPRQCLEDTRNSEKTSYIEPAGAVRFREL